MRIVAVVVPAEFALVPVTAVAAGTSCEKSAPPTFLDTIVGIGRNVPADDFVFDVGHPTTNPKNRKTLRAVYRATATPSRMSESDIEVEIGMPEIPNGKSVVNGVGDWAAAISYFDVSANFISRAPF